MLIDRILAQKRKDQWFRIPAVKGTALEFNVYARRLRSPVDSVLEVFDHAGKSLASNDDSAGPDSVLKLTPSETTNYFVKVSDRLGLGGTDFVYRVEITPVRASTP